MMEQILSNLSIFSIVLMVVSFVAFLFIKRKFCEGDNLLIEAIKIALVAAIIPKIVVLFISAFDQSYFKYINNLPETITLISLVLCFYVWKMFYEAFKQKV